MKIFLTLLIFIATSQQVLKAQQIDYKGFPAGDIVLPGADAAANGVLRNYFVMVKKKTDS